MSKMGKIDFQFEIERVFTHPEPERNSQVHLTATWEDIQLLRVRTMNLSVKSPMDLHHSASRAIELYWLCCLQLHFSDERVLKIHRRTQLARRVRFSEYVQPVCLYDGVQKLKRPNELVATGHGVYNCQKIFFYSETASSSTRRELCDRLRLREAAPHED